MDEAFSLTKGWWDLPYLWKGVRIRRVPSTESAKMLVGDRTSAVTFRKPALSVFASVGIAVTVLVMTLMAVKGVRDLFTAAIIVSLFAYLCWLVGWHSAVRLRPDGVVIDNLLVRHEIPWYELSEIGVRNGLVLRLRDGERIGSVMYGGSVIGALLGYRYTQGVAARMSAARAQILGGSPLRPDGGAYHRGIGFSPWPPLLILAVMEAIAALSLLTG